jgi:Leu/Phe-tRNA-protein transferase
MPPETPSVEQAAPKERQDLETRQEVPDQSAATQAHRRVVYRMQWLRKKVRWWCPGPRAASVKRKLKLANSKRNLGLLMPQNPKTMTS